MGYRGFDMNTMMGFWGVDWEKVKDDKKLKRILIDICMIGFGSLSFIPHFYKLVFRILFIVGIVRFFVFVMKNIPKKEKRDKNLIQYEKVETKKTPIKLKLIDATKIERK